MRSVDLAVYADALAAEAAAIAARIEQARRLLREAAIEHEARLALPPEVVPRLVELGFLRGAPIGARTAELAELVTALRAVAVFQTWVEQELAAAQGSSQAGTEARSLSPVPSAER
jgi:hypothetical protein